MQAINPSKIGQCQAYIELRTGDVVLHKLLMQHIYRVYRRVE